jgi:hypothetical protein
MTRYQNLGATWVEVDVAGIRGERRVYATDCHPDRIDEWHCPAPPDGVTFTVTRAEWSTMRVENLAYRVVIETPWGQRRIPTTMPLRRIYAIEVEIPLCG